MQFFFFFQAEDGIRDVAVTGVQTCALPISLNAYFTYSIVLGRGVPWKTALGVVFLSGVLFLLLTLSNIREQVVNAIPDCLKHGTAAGIGLFIAFIGFCHTEMIVANSAAYVRLWRIFQKP